MEQDNNLAAHLSAVWDIYDAYLQARRAGRHLQALQLHPIYRSEFVDGFYNEVLRLGHEDEETDTDTIIQNMIDADNWNIDDIQRNRMLRNLASIHGNAIQRVLLHLPNASLDFANPPLQRQDLQLFPVNPNPPSDAGQGQENVPPP